MYKVSTEKDLLDVELVIAELQRSYWASNRSENQIRKSIENSLCFGAYEGDRQIGFARVVTDFSTVAYLCDVFVVEKCKGRGIGKNLIKEVLSHPDLAGISWFLRTKDAHGLYEQFDFKRTEQPDRYMEKRTLRT